MAKSAEAEVQKMKQLEERIKAPSIWGRSACGVRFEDLQDKRYEDVVRMLKKHYLPHELTYRSVKLAEDKEGTDEFIHNCRIWMKDKMSIVAVKEGTDQVVGVLIMRIQEKQAFSRTFSRVKLTHNPLYSTVMTFYNTIEKPINLFKELEVRKYFKVYVLMLKNRYRHRGIAKEMLKSAYKLAASGCIPAIAGIFTTSSTQKIAEDIGFTKRNEIYYVRYLINDEVSTWVCWFVPGLAKEMLKAAIAMSSNAMVPVIAGIFTTARTQQIADELGFDKRHVIEYDKYLVDDKIVFWDTGLGNYGAALMAYRIPDIDEPEELHPQHSSRFNIQPIDDDDDDET